MQIQTAELIHLLHETPHAVLSTHSTQMSGFPYGTAVSLVVNNSHQPVLLVSALAEHTKNLLADSRASLAVVESGLTNVQDARRATLVGHFLPIDPTPEFVSRYLRYQPDAEHYLSLDFTFFRMTIERVRYIGGIGKMGWIDCAQVEQAASNLPEAIESSLIDLALQRLPDRFQLLGIDCYGIDYLADGFRDRLGFDAVKSRESIETELPNLLLKLN